MHFVIRVQVIPVVGPTYWVSNKFKLVHDRRKALVFTHREDAEHVLKEKRFGVFGKVIEVE